MAFKNFHNLKYRPDIDGLRAIAVLYVVVFHSFPYLFKGGFIGVDIFFVISGYLISSIIFENLDKEAFSFREFYSRRIKRIFPALIIVLFACFAGGWLTLTADEYAYLGRHIAGGSTFVSNFILWNESGYFDRSSELKILLHLWSLALEEQFYILWPLLIWVAHKRKINSLTLILFIAICSFSINIYLASTNASADFYSPQSRFWELMIGGIVAYISIYYPEYITNTFKKINSYLHLIGVEISPLNLANIFSFFAFLLLFLGLIYINSNLNFPGKFALIPVLSAAAIILVGPHTWLNRVVLSNSLFVWFGLISFPLYLWHWPLLSFARIISANSLTVELKVLVILISIFLAWITYKYVELRFRNKKSNSRKVTVLSILLLALFVLGVSTWYFKGYPNRSFLKGLDKPPEVVANEDEEEEHRNCLAQFELQNTNIRFCRVSNILNPHIAIIGDSHAASIFKGLSEKLAEINKGLLMIGGRLFINVATYPDGDSREIEIYKGGAEATRFVARNKQFDTVIIVSRGPFYIYDKWNFYLIDEPGDFNKLSVYEKGLKATLDLLVKNNKKIILFLDTPEFPFDPKSCLNLRPFKLFSSEKGVECKIDKSKFLARHKEYRKMIFDLLKKYPEIKVFDPSIFLCDSSYCYAKLGSSLMFYDSDHLSYEGSKFISKQLVEFIDAN